MRRFFEKHAANPLFQSVRRVDRLAAEDCWVAVTRYARIAGNPMQQTRDLLESLVALVDRSALAEVAGTGQGRQTAPVGI